jgi:glycerol-3-phosphate dehydrogenase
MADSTFDLLVIGGGITGAGVAREASLRGLRVALVEQSDFASGTSSRSTKLIHGGLRNLKQFDFRLVAEAVRERQLLLRMAPHVVEATPFLFPVYRGDPDGLLALRAGLFIYDLFARLRAPVPHRLLSASAVLEAEPGLRSGELHGGALYTDSRTDDARLTLLVLESAHQLGATIANYARVDGFLRQRDGRITGARIVDALSGHELDVRAARVLAAVGPWADKVRQLDDPAVPSILRLTKGVHATVPGQRLPVRHAVVIRGRDAQRRMMFAIPRGDFTYVGTTDTDHIGPPEAVCVERADIDYILDAANAAFPGARLTDAEVVSAWVGLRPLVRPARAASPSAVSREYELFRSPSGLVTVGGGKLTAFRAMAQHIVDELVPTSRPTRAGLASSAPLPGADGDQPTDRDWASYAEAPSMTPTHLRQLCGGYGARLADVAARLPVERTEDPALAWHVAMTRYAVEYEMAQRLEDVYLRRTGLMLFSRYNGRNWLEALSGEMGRLLGWSVERRREEVAHTAASIDRMFAFRGFDQTPVTFGSQLAGRTT